MTSQQNQAAALAVDGVDAAIALLGGAQEVLPRFPLSVVILARNEARNIPRCLDSLTWCDEVVVVDDGSTDQTAQLAREHGARVVQHPFESFARQRNWALDHAELKHDWVLMLDADECSSPEFQRSLKDGISRAGEDVAAFRTCRQTMLAGTWVRYADEFPCWIMRLVRRGRARFEDCGHGEVALPPVSGRMETVPVPFVHYPFSHGLSDWLVRHVRYAEREAALELAQRRPLRLAELCSRDYGVRRAALRSLSRRLPFRPALRFFYQAVLRGGVMEGRPGLMFSLLKAIYEGMIVVKRWELSQENPDAMESRLPSVRS